MLSPVRILVASDVHYRLPSLDWLCSVAAEYDAIVLAGDLLDIANPVPIHAQIVVLDSYLRRLSGLTRVFAASGNHDLDGPGVHGEQACAWLPRSRSATLHTDGESVDLDNLRITICPWWDGPATRADVDAQLRAAAIGRPELWLWIYHSPPAGTVLCSDGRRSFPDQELADWIAAYHPDLVMCGHIHQAPWAPGGGWYDRVVDAWVFNAGHVRARVPPHIVLDTVAGTAVWRGVGDGELETIDLQLGELDPAL
jgi:Icc-related predicted phosphoesterase